MKNKSKKIGMLFPTESSCEKLMILSSLLDLNPFTNYNQEPTNDPEFHLTMFISKQEIDYPNFTYFLPVKMDLIGHTIRVLGDRATVLEVEKSPYLLGFKQQIMNEMKVTDRFPDFIAHTSLSYVLNDSIDVKDKIMIEPIRLTFDRLIIEDADF